MIRRIFFYIFFLSIPFFLGLSAWQTSRYGDLERELERLEKTQEEWVENNKRLIAGIAILSSPDRIENIAVNELHLQKKRPEDVLQISIRGAVPAAAQNPAGNFQETAGDNRIPEANLLTTDSIDALALIQKLLDGDSGD